nr:hypothetical protein [uncultured Carboxylicivirga sp.]
MTKLNIHFLLFFVFIFLINISTNAQQKDVNQIKSLATKSWRLLEEKQYEKSRDTAELLLKVDSCSSSTYALLGTIYAKYAAEGNTEDDLINRSLIYCLVIDMYEKAKQVDPGYTQQADTWIEVYSSYLPDHQSTFINIQERDEVILEGWINRKTKFRYKP